MILKVTLRLPTLLSLWLSSRRNRNFGFELECLSVGQNRIPMLLMDSRQSNVWGLDSFLIIESRNSYVHEEEQCRRSKTKSNNVVYTCTKPVNIYFLVVWLATQARDILWYLLVCKTQWTSTSNHPFQLNFDQIKLLFLSLVIHWFGIYTKTIIPRDLPSWCTPWGGPKHLHLVTDKQFEYCIFGCSKVFKLLLKLKIISIDP